MSSTRVLIINSEYPPVGGGAGTASAHLARTLVAQGHQVTVLTTRFRGLPTDREEDGVNVLRRVPFRRSADRSDALEQLAFMVLACFYVVRLGCPDFTIAYFGIPSGPAAWVMKALYKVPFIVSLRGGDVPGFRKYDFKTFHRLGAPIIRFVWRRAAAVVANSRGLRAMAVAFEPSQEVAIIPNGVDAHADPAGDRDWNAPELIFTGRVVYQKGLDLLFKALADLKHLDWRLTIVGDGPRTADLQRMAAEFGYAERVRFPGWLSRVEVIAHLRRANLFVYPSRDEGMPNAVLEAMASGLPVIATRIAGNEELVLEGQTGLLVPPEDVAALRAALAELIPDAARRRALGAAAFARVHAEYTLARVAEAYLDLGRKAQEGRG
ncbi:MAG: glycosyltransferase family 4 protein [Anaerolineae bacterium]|nr:MAG: glycosyltransferase family 4 protein [Anaerolineae bacterium]